MALPIIVSKYNYTRIAGVFGSKGRNTLKIDVTITHEDNQNIPPYVYEVNGHEIIRKVFIFVPTQKEVSGK